MVVLANAVPEGRLKVAPGVNFVVAGAQKAGTSALRHFLSSHSEIGLAKPDIREPHFFDREILKDKTADYDRYHAMFSADDLAKVTGDVTPIYIFKDGCMEQIRSYNPQMKVVVLLRNPVDRAYSQWVMEFSRGNEDRPFLAALVRELLGMFAERQHPVRSYLQRGFYGRQIARLYRLFPRDQCLVLLNEDMSENHAETYRRVLEFLRVNTEEIPPAETIHSRDYEPVSPFLRRVLGLIYHRDIKKLEKMTGLDCSRWR